MTARAKQRHANATKLAVVGVKKVNFDASNGKGEYWIELQGNYGARMQGAYEFQPVFEMPACALKLTVP